MLHRVGMKDAKRGIRCEGQRVRGGLQILNNDVGTQNGVGYC